MTTSLITQEIMIINNFNSLVYEIKKLKQLVDVDNMLSVIRNLNIKLANCRDGLEKLQAFIEAADNIKYIKFNTLNKSKLKICLWNATSINGKELELNYFLINNKIDIAIITETWLNPNIRLTFADTIS